MSTSLKRKLGIVVMGSKGVGKTSLINQFMDANHTTEYYGSYEQIHSRRYSAAETTVEMVEIRNGEDVPTVREQAIVAADAVILMYAVDDAQSFEYIYTLRDLVMDLKGCNSTVPILVLANKLDVTEDRQTPIWQVADAIVTIDWENRYAEVSAKDSLQVHNVVEDLISQCPVSRKAKCHWYKRPCKLINRLRTKLRTNSF